jgi:hypothetical protein
MELMVKAMKARVGSPLRKLVLIKLADNANDLGECWPSYQHIADQCEMSRRSVMMHIDVLCKGGLIRKEIRKGGPKGNSSNIYMLQLTDGAKLSLPLVQEIHQGSAADAPPSAADALPPSAADAPRISHSFEPVIEPVIEPICGTAIAELADGENKGLVIADLVAPRCNIPSDMPGPKDPKCKTFKTWANYAMAYRNRYKAWPVWNAKVAGQVGLLIGRLGSDVSHSVAAHYLSNSDAQLIRKCHSLNELLANAEAYHTQWVTQVQINGRTAKQMEDRQANMVAGEDAARRIMERRSQGGERNEFL